MKELLLGNAAVARGLYEGGCRFVSSYPGTPSTEITEHAALYKEIYAEWAPNEKVALEAAIGAAVGGGRAFCAMKHVGLNVAADPLFTVSYTGINAGLVIAVADDMGMHSSQNEQDSRHYARSSKVMMLEPSDSAECKEYTKLAFDLSEQYDTPVLLRLSTRISHARTLVEFGERNELDLKEYAKNPAKYVMMPNNARGRHVVVEERTKKLIELAETDKINKIELGSKKIGIISAGIAYQYAKEALGDNASYLKLGMLFPLPERKIIDFCKQCEKVYVIEELDDYIEAHCKKLGLKVEGKDLFSPLGEYHASEIKEKILGEKTEVAFEKQDVPVRPPVMCAGCPHRGLFYILNKLKLTVSGDIGCYTLGANAPLNAMDTTICMGASVSLMHGLNTVRGEEQAAKTVGVIGDSTFIHSGITGLIDVVYNKGISTLLILDNSITGMTGHQQNPTTGLTLQNEPTASVSLEKLCEAVGVKRIRVVDPNNIKELESIIKEEVLAKEPSVIITRRPCALLKTVKAQPAPIVNDKCTGCKVCLKIGCPAICVNDKKMIIDTTLCNGCGLCISVCPFGAIEKENSND